IEDRFVVMATKKGRVKKTKLMSYSRPRSGGLIGIKLAEGDELIAARITGGDDDIVLGSDGGKVIRFNENDVRETARGSMGVKGMNIGSNAAIVGMETFSHGTTLLCVTEHGFGKRTSVEEYRTQNRGGKGVFSIKTSARNGKMVSLLVVDDTEEIMMITDKGKLIRTPVKDMSIISRNTLGVKLINCDPKEKLIAVERVPEEQEDEENGEDDES
ncbi:MAG: DNA gyrase subunit A, partial [Desulfobacteraceae bacterium]|nr:DNA gyrase subunit A [Desulfobacteraceae bacterium]